MKYPALQLFSQVLPELDQFDTIIDVRSPAEFALDHLPGAVNLPVLTNEERERVASEERVRLVVVGEVEPVGRGRHRSLPICPVDACARETHLPPLMA